MWGKMKKYDVLLNILDKIRAEAASTQRASKYLPEPADIDSLNQARARAFIHLLLKVKFGLLDFTEREHFITDGANDGGIDGYYIDSETKLIYFIQSKFRTTESNFINKQIALEELLATDVTRIVEGHEVDENGNGYNGKIFQLQREIRQIDEIARYKYKMIVLANLESSTPDKLSRLVGGFSCETINYERCFETLVFPVISGTYFKAADLVIHLDLSNKNAGSKISYTVDTRYGECDITVLFVPTIEIARTFHKYKNAMLEFNPRSYLELEGAKVNNAIRDTILQQGKNEFALYNNGITMLSDETYLNERIGQRNKARLNVKNPQIINGGQTAYTLSRIYEEGDPEKIGAVFEGKEVLLKIITVASQNGDGDDKKRKLIDSISVATNDQTAVIPADRYSNDLIHVRLQKELFERYGLLYERKRGEFADGVHKGYIGRSQIIERNLFFRIYLASHGEINQAVERKAFIRFSKSGKEMPSLNTLDRFYFGYLCSFALGNPIEARFWRKDKEVHGQIYAMTTLYMPPILDDFESALANNKEQFLARWQSFLETMQAKNERFLKSKVDRTTGESISFFQFQKWFRSNQFEEDVKSFFGSNL